MKWEKKGLIIGPNQSVSWMSKYAMMPTPILDDKTNTIRIYFGVTDVNNFGSTTYADVDAQNPNNILYVKNDTPVINFGIDGTFDDAGAISSSIVALPDLYLLYYVGFQRLNNVPFMLFPGLAVSKDGSRFEKVSQSPIIDRSAKYFLSFAAPFVLKDENIFKMWLWIANAWTIVKGKKYLNATIGYAESVDGIGWEIRSDSCICPNTTSEFSLGRPWVIKEDGIYKMFYSIRFVDKLYRLGYAESNDGINWLRKDDEVGIDISETGWDSEMICYPAVIKVKNRTYLFYNGNNNGETGFGWAELVNK